jgi:hypothetical protein
MVMMAERVAKREGFIVSRRRIGVRISGVTGISGKQLWQDKDDAGHAMVVVDRAEISGWGKSLHRH